MNFAALSVAVCRRVYEFEVAQKHVECNVRATLDCLRILGLFWPPSPPASQRRMQEKEQERERADVAHRGLNYEPFFLPFFLERISLSAAFFT